MGGFEVFSGYLCSLIFGIIMYNVINIFHFKNLLKSFGIFKLGRKDFYECGFSPQTQKPIKLPMQFLLMCMFFLLYDIELLFFFPFISGMWYIGFFDLVLFTFFMLLFMMSLVIDYDSHALYWQY